MLLRFWTDRSRQAVWTEGAVWLESTLNSNFAILSACLDQNHIVQSLE